MAWDGSNKTIMRVNSHFQDQDYTVFLTLHSDSGSYEIIECSDFFESDCEGEDQVGAWHVTYKLDYRGIIDVEYRFNNDDDFLMAQMIDLEN